MKKKALVFGSTGQDGSYMLELLIKKNYQVHGIIRRSATGNTKNINHLINNKKIYFSLNSNLNAKFRASFNSEGVTQHSARPDGKYHVEGLEIKVKDAESVRLVFDKHKISEGDTFKAYSDSQPSGLEFTINKVEELKAEAK